MIMVSDKKCCVPGCFDTGASHQVLHVFPNPEKNPDRFQAWRKAVGGDILDLPDSYVYKYRRVCHAHFEEKFHCRNDRLSNIAVPSVHLPDHQLFCIHDHNGYQKTQFPDSRLDGVTQEKNNGIDLFSKEGPETHDEVTSEATEVHIQGGDQIEWDSEVEKGFDKKTEEGYEGERQALNNLYIKTKEYCAKPKPLINPDELEDPYLPDNTDPDVIDTKQPHELPTFGNKLIHKVCNMWADILTNGLSNDARNTIMKGYPIPYNSIKLKTPQMNSQIVQLVPGKVIANDDRWATMQQYIGTAVTAISRAMEALVCHKGEILAIRHLSNSCLILCDLHYTHTRIRAKNVLPYLDDVTKEIVNDCQRDYDTVFGETFSRKWNAAKLLIKKPPSKRKQPKKNATGRSLVLFSGRWHPSLNPKPKRKKAVKKQDTSDTDSLLTTPTKKEIEEKLALNKPGTGAKRKLNSLDGIITKSPIRRSKRIAKRAVMVEVCNETISLDQHDVNTSQPLDNTSTDMDPRSTQEESVEDQLHQYYVQKHSAELHNQSYTIQEGNQFHQSYNIQEETTEEQLRQYHLSPNSTVMITTGAVPLPQSLSRQRSLSQMPTKNMSSLIKSPPKRYYRGKTPLVLPQEIPSRDIPRLDLPQEKPSRDMPTFDLPQQIPSRGMPPLDLPQKNPSRDMPPSDLPQQISSRGMPPLDLPQKNPSRDMPPSEYPSRGMPPSGLPQQIPTRGMPPLDLPQKNPSRGMPPSDLPQQIPSRGMLSLDLPQKNPSRDMPPSIKWYKVV